jgi:hypothetical protein
VIGAHGSRLCCTSETRNEHTFVRRIVLCTPLFFGRRAFVGDVFAIHINTYSYFYAYTDAYGEAYTDSEASSYTAAEAVVVFAKANIVAIGDR